MNAIARFTFGRPIPDERAGPAVAARPGTMLVGRILLATIFVMAGINKFFDFEGTRQMMQAQGVPWVTGLLAIAALAEIGGGLSILTGTVARIGALGLLAYLVITTLVFHDFWSFSGAERQVQMVNFLKNLAIMGGLILLIAEGPGRYSLDRMLRPEAPEPGAGPVPPARRIETGPREKRAKRRREAEPREARAGVGGKAEATETAPAEGAREAAGAPKEAVAAGEAEGQPTSRGPGEPGPDRR
jgi:putative oxidoreductase